MNQPQSYSRRFTELAEAGPERPAVTVGERTVTRGELERTTNRLARAYAALGVGQDDFVALALPNSIAFIEALMAVWKLGATPMPVSYRLPHAELQALIDLGNPALLVGRPAEEFPGRTCVPADYAAAAEFPETLLEDRVAAHSRVMHSGGSTGRPKLIVLPAPTTMERLPLYEALFRMKPDRAHLVPGPLYHTIPFGVATITLGLGNHLVLLERFDALETVRTLERWRVDWTPLVPTMMHRIWRLGRDVLDGFDLSSLRVVLHAAAPCSPWLKEAWIDWLGADRIHELYGGSEMQSITWITGQEWLTHRGSVGKPVTGKIQVLDEHGQPAPAGQLGEVFLQADEGPNSTYRYIGAEAKRRGEWESLGDMGRLDEEGYLYLADRQTDMILSGGANIYPAEVESALDSHPAVRSSCVIGLPDDDMGNRTHAIIDAVHPVSEADLKAHVATHLVSYKIPRSFEFVQEPLRDDAGKVRRSALRQARLAPAV